MQETGTTNVKTTCDQCKKTVSWEYERKDSNILQPQTIQRPMKRIAIFYSIDLKNEKRIEVDLCSFDCLEKWLIAFGNEIKMSF